MGRAGEIHPRPGATVAGGRPLSARRRALTREARASPAFQALCVGALAGGVAARVLPERSQAVLVGCASALAQRRATTAAQERDRQLEGLKHVALLVPLLSGTGAFFGDFSIEPDFGRILTRHVTDGAQTIVECGSGTSTVLIARLLAERGAGRLYSVEHEAAYAAQTSRLLADAGLDGHVEMIVAPLRRQRFGSHEIDWYDLNVIARHDVPPIDLLVVDGPRCTSSALVRWPAVEVFHAGLSPDATVLLDDGRRRTERRTALRWSAAHPDLELSWIDTVKGTWQLRRRSAAPRTGSSRVLQTMARNLNARPRGSGLVPVER